MKNRKLIAENCEKLEKLYENLTCIDMIKCNFRTIKNGKIWNLETYWLIYGEFWIKLVK